MRFLNIKKIFFLFFTLFFLIHPQLSANTEKNIVRINKLKIEGYKHIEQSEVENAIATEFPSLKPWVKKPEFDEGVLEDDLLRLKELFSKHGFYDTKCSYKLKFNDNRDRVEIKIDIDQGDPILLRSFDFEFDEEGFDDIKETLEKEIKLEVGKDFSAIKFQQTKSIISDILSNEGYPKLSIKADAVVNKKEKWAEAAFIIQPGDKFSFGSISIEGNKKIPSYLIHREILYESGDIYSLEKLEESQGKIFQLGYFRSVVINTSFDDIQKLVITNIKVEERKLGNVRFGVGFGTEDKLRGQIGWTQRNFFGGGRSLEVLGKFSFITQRIQTSITQPYIMGRDSEFVGILNFQRDDLPSFEGNSVNTTARINKRFSRFFESYGSFDIIYARIDSQATRTPIEESRENIFLTTFGGGLRFDTTDSILNPTKGLLTDVNIETALRIFQSDVSYFKTSIELRGYRKFRKVVFAKRLNIGILDSFGDTEEFEIPIFKRFFAGGSTSMRGFPFQKLGPLDSSEDPIGGNSLIVGNAEARFPVYKKVGGVIFFDYGNVFSKSFDYSLDKLKYAVGAGLRYKTIVGPIRLDLGYALNPNDELKRFQVFLSIGQAF